MGNLRQDDRTPHDKLREIFAEFGLAMADGRSPLDWTDEETEAAVARIVKAAARFNEAVRDALMPALQRVVVQLNTALVPITTRPALMAAIERANTARQRV